MKKILIKLGGSAWVLLLMFVFLSPTVRAEEVIRAAFIDTGVSCRYIDEARVAEGKNYVFPEQDTTDRNGHGTAIAGILLGSEEMGLAGSASEAEIVPLVIYDCYPSGVAKNGGVEAIADAIYDAVDVFGCRVINISMGVPADNEELRTAVEYAEERGVVIVSAVGNVNDTNPDYVYYPAAYPTVIGVGAADGNKAADFSQRNSVSVLAQGVDIPCVTIRNSGEAEMNSGTSYSCVTVTAFCCRLLENDPSLTPEEIRLLLYMAAQDIGESGVDSDSGWGLVSAEMADTGISSEVTRAETAEILAGLLGYHAANTGFYTDIADHPQAYAINACTEAGIFVGTENTVFSPDMKLTQAMLVTVLYRLAGCPLSSEDISGDSTGKTWYSDAAAWAGVTEDFAPDSAVTRIQFARALADYLTE